MTLAADSRPVRLFYLDDSGANETGYVTYSWVEFRIEDWRRGLGAVLAWRKDLLKRFQIPVNYEIHSTKFANGRGNPSIDAAWNRSKANRSVVMTEAFDLIESCDWVKVGTVYSTTDARRRGYTDERERVYRELVSLIDERLTAAGEYGILVMDGDGNDHSYMAAHRNLKLQTRSIMEDPFFGNSRLSQWVQLADIVAYAAYQSLLCEEKKRFAWGWYPGLQAQDVHDGPKCV